MTFVHENITRLFTFGAWTYRIIGGYRNLVPESTIYIVVPDNHKTAVRVCCVQQTSSFLHLDPALHGSSGDR